MASKEPIETVYTKDSVITKNALFTIYKAEINLDKFNYDMLYAYTQVSGLTLNKRAAEAEKFAQKLSEKNLDNQTIRTILETQNIELPPKSATFIESTNSYNKAFFQSNHNLFLYTQHPNLITIYSSEIEDDKIYIATESLGNRLPTEKIFETFTQEGKINLIIQVSRAVASLHSNKIIHHNICPENIFALPQPNGICQIKLLANGIIPDITSALDIGGGSEYKPLFAFTSPELLTDSISSANSTEKEDIYALGGVLYFYLSGQRPWQNCRSLFDIIKACKNNEPSLIDEDFKTIPDNLKSVIIKATHTNPEIRYSNVAEFISDLEACRDGKEPSSMALLNMSDNAADNSNAEPVESAPEISDITHDITDVNPQFNNTSEDKTTNTPPDTPKEEYKSNNILKEEDLPQPNIEPDIPDINEISPELNNTSSKIWSKLGIAASIIIAATIGGYYFLSPDKTATTSVEDSVPDSAQQTELSLEKQNSTTQTPDTEEVKATETPVKTEVTPDPAELAKQEEEKERQRLKALEEEEQRRLDNEYNTAIAAGNQAMADNKYEIAVIEYQKANSLNNTDEASGLLQAAKLKRQAEVNYEKLLNNAQQLLNSKRLEEAEAVILQAKNISGYAGDPRADQIIDNIHKIRFEDAMAEGEKLLSEEKYEEAELAFAWALSIPGFDNNEDAIKFRQLAQETLQKIAEEQLKVEEENRQRKTQYIAALNEGEKLLAQKRWDDAAAAFSLALEVPGYSDDTKALNGRKTALTNKDQEIQRLHEAKEKALVSEYNRLINNGNTYLNAGLWQKAEENFSKALEIEGFSGDMEAEDGRKKALENNRLSTNRQQYDNLILSGMKAIKNNNYPDAEKSFRDALLIPGFDNGEAARQGIMFAENLNDIDIKAKTFNDYIDSGKDNLLNKDPEEAIRDFGKAIVAAPDQVDPYILRGSAYLEAGNIDKALENFEEALAVDPDYDPALLGKAITYFKAKNYPRAFDSFAVIASDTDNSELKALSNNVSGWIYLKTDDRSKNDNIPYDNDKAKYYFEQNSGSNDSIALNNLGYMYIEGEGVRKDYETAVSFFEEASDNGLPEATFNLGMAYYKGYGVKRNYETAFNLFKTAAESDKLPIAWGQVAEMYRRGRGVKKNNELSAEYAEKYNGKTNRDTVFLVSKPKLILPLPINHLNAIPEPIEFERQYNAFIDLGRKLIEIEEYDSAKRMYSAAAMVDGYDDSEEIKIKIAEVEDLKNNKEKAILADIIEIKKQDDFDDLLTEESLDDLSKELAELNPVKPQQPRTDLEDILASLDDSESSTASDKADTIEVISEPASEKDISESRFGKEYVKLINIAEQALSNQNWLIAEQAFRLALALPDSPDRGDALAGLNTAVRERENSNSATSAVLSNYAAILGNATALLKEAQWPQAIYLFQSAIDYNEEDDDSLAEMGLSIAEAANSNETADNTDSELDIKTDERDIASHNMAIAQSKQFLADGNFDAAIQMLEIALAMKGFEDDPVAEAMLMTAKKMKLENDNSPEAMAAKRAKNKPIYDKLIKSGELQAASGNLEGAKNSYQLALKIPGYQEDEPALRGLKQIEELINRPSVTEESKEKYDSLMAQAREAIDSSDWARAEETYRLVLSLPEFTNDPDALAGLRTAAQAQNKPLPDTGDIGEDLLQNGLIPADADMDQIRRRAEFEALIREGKRQLELKQYEVAEAMFNEALKIEGYQSNPDGLSLLNRTLSLKPKVEEVKLPTHPEEEENPQLDMQRQAAMLLEEGNRLRAQKQFDKAIQAYSSGIDLDPKNLRLFINRADTNAGIGKFDIALNDYLKVIDSENADDEVKSYTWNNVANVYYYGKKDYASAVEFYIKAAEIGNLASMNSLGVCYGFAKGVEKDPQKSLEWYTKAAEGGYGNAMLNLGMMYQNGWGIDTDLQQAKKWYEKAAEHNVPRAFIRLSLMYANGTGVEQDQLKADEYKQRAVELGYTADR